MTLPRPRRLMALSTPKALMAVRPLPIRFGFGTMRFDMITTNVAMTGAFSTVDQWLIAMATRV